MLTHPASYMSMEKGVYDHDFLESQLQLQYNFGTGTFISAGHFNIEAWYS